MQKQAAAGRGSAWVDYPPQGWDPEVGYPAPQPIAGQHPPHNPQQQPRIAQLSGPQVQRGYAQQNAAYVQQQQHAYAYYAQQSAAYAQNGQFAPPQQQQQPQQPKLPAAPAVNVPFRPPASQKSRPWAGDWYDGAIILLMLYVGMLASYVVYLVFRIRYTLKTAVNPQDSSSNARYTISFYPIFTLFVEVLCMAAMALYAVNKVFYPKRTWRTPRPETVKGAFRVAVCVCCYKEPTETVAGTMAAAAIAIRAAVEVGLIAKGTAVWLCDDTPKLKGAQPGEPEPYEAGECRYTLAGHQFSHKGYMRTNREQLIANLRLAFPDVAFCHRLPTAPIRQAEHNGLNKKSGNLNATLREIWPADVLPSDRDVLVVLDADQAAFSDFLTVMLPCLDAGKESDNLALVQSPQCFIGVNPLIDIFNHQNVEFWSTLMVAYNRTGFISCAGTNFAIRATALRALGDAPFPTHTVTEDFALGMRLRAHNPPFAGLYLPTQLVRGTAPDTIRAAYKQRSRWAKGPFQMMISKESPFWYCPPEGAPRQTRLSVRDRIGFLAPVFNTVVNCISTPFYCFVPCFFIWTGRFPASLTLHAIIAGMVATGFTLFFKYFARPRVGVATVKTVGGKVLTVKGEVVREHHSIASYLMAEYNADINIRNFWWLFAKVVMNFFLRCCGIRRQAGFKSSVGGAEGVFSGFLDILPLSILWFLLMASLAWACLQLYVGARLLGPLGICMAWALYQAIPPGAKMFYVLLRVRHEPAKRGCCWCYENFGRRMFTFIHVGGFFVSWACLLAACVLAILTLPRHSAFTQNVRTFTDSSGQTITYHMFYSVKDTFDLLKGSLQEGKNWQWHW